MAWIFNRKSFTVIFTLSLIRYFLGGPNIIRQEAISLFKIQNSNLPSEESNNLLNTTYLFSPGPCQKKNPLLVSPGLGRVFEKWLLVEDFIFCYIKHLLSECWHKNVIKKNWIAFEGIWITICYSIGDFKVRLLFYLFDCCKIWSIPT